MFSFIFFYLGIFHLKTNSNIMLVEKNCPFLLREILSKGRKAFLRISLGKKISVKQEKKISLSTGEIQLSHKRFSTVRKNFGGFRVCVIFFSVYSLHKTM